MNGEDAEAGVAAAAVDDTHPAKKKGASELEPPEHSIAVGDAEASGSMACMADEENLGNVPVPQDPETSHPKVTLIPFLAPITAMRPPLTCCCGPPCRRRKWPPCS